MNRSYLFWLAAVFGILIGIYVYFRFMNNKEHFAVNESTKDASSASTSSVANTTDECPAGTFVEDTSLIPYNDKMMLYLSSFSTSITDNSIAPYCPNMLRWYDLRNRNIYFNVNTISPPSNIIDEGLPTKNIILIGPPSDFLTDDRVYYKLKPFTIFFYAALEEIDFTEQNYITLFRIYAETPNSVKLVLKRSDMLNHTRVDLIIGNDRNRYVWNITTSTLLSNGNPSLYALTVDTNPKSKDKTATFYIGKSKYTAEIKLDGPIKLGNTRMEINSQGQLDAKLYSFGFIDKKLTETEIDKLAEYMAKQQTGVDREASMAAKTTQETADMKIQELEERLAESDRFSSTNRLTERKAERILERATKAEQEREAKRLKEEAEKTQLEIRNAARIQRQNERLAARAAKKAAKSNNSTQEGTQEGSQEGTQEDTQEGSTPFIKQSKQIRSGATSDTTSQQTTQDATIAPPSIPPPKPKLTRKPSEPVPAPTYKNNEYNVSNAATIKESEKSTTDSSVLQNTSLSRETTNIQPPKSKSTPGSSGGKDTIMNKIRYTLNNLVDKV